MAALLVLLVLLTEPLTMISAANVYYVTANNADDESCPTNQICHELSYYIANHDPFFTSNTTIIFLEGEHSFNTTELHVTNVHNLTLKGQGQWPIAGAEETVMQSTVIINCTRGKGGFIFDTGNDITIEGLTITNCGKVEYASIYNAVFCFVSIHNLLFQKNL